MGLRPHGAGQVRVMVGLTMVRSDRYGVMELQSFDGVAALAFQWVVASEEIS